VVMGSHDIALDVVLGALAEQGFVTRTLAVGSLGGVAAARRGEGDIAPVHPMAPDGETYNTHLLPPGPSPTPGWQPQQGVVYGPGDERFAGRSAEAAVSAASADAACIMVNRNAGAGTRILIDRLLGGARPPGYGNQPRSHNAVAAAVAQGRADWGVAIEPIARLYGLGFLPLTPESYDFLLVEKRRARGPPQALFAALRRAGGRARLPPL